MGDRVWNNGLPVELRRGDCRIKFPRAPSKLLSWIDCGDCGGLVMGR